MSATVEKLLATRESDACSARNDNRMLEIAPGLVASIPSERIERAARALARRFVDLAIREADEASRGDA